MNTNQIARQILPAFFGLNTDRIPSAALCEKEGAYELEVELPGVQKENVDIQIENGILQISATRKRGESEMRFRKEFRVADEIETDSIQAAFENGLLTLSIEKKHTEARKIKIA